MTACSNRQCRQHQGDGKPQGMTVELMPDEVLLCEMLGRLRSIVARSAAVTDRKMGDQDGSSADVIGLKGEYAFAKCFNTFPDLGLTPRSGSADGILKGFRYDVKATEYKHGQLLATQKINPDIDIYVLCIVTGSTVEIKGYSTKENFINPSNLKDLGHGEGYAMQQDSLQSFKV